jgi:hypothetical protein
MGQKIQGFIISFESPMYWVTGSATIEANEPLIAKTININST